MSNERGLPIRMDGTKAPVDVWSHDVEYGALNQLRNVASMPWVKGVKAMPDIHQGYGVPIGTVVAMDQAVSPSAVGVDIGCVDAATEYLSPHGWRRIDQYVTGLVAQYDPDNGTSSMVQPLRYVVRDQREPFYHFKTKYGIDQMLTGDHRVLRWQVEGRDRHEVRQVVAAAEHAAEHGRLQLGSKARFATTFTPDIETRLPLTDEQLRVQVMFMADGCIERGRRGVLQFKKQRKIDRCEKLLDAAGISFTRKDRDDGVTCFRMTPPMLVKTYRNFWQASVAQLQVISEECLLWDGSEQDRVFYTRDSDSADFIHYVFAACGWTSVLRVDPERNNGVDYRVFAHSNTKVSMSGSPKSPIERVPSVDGKAYCFTVPSGFLVLRRNGNIFMTGNCGVNAVKTSLTIEDLDDLGPIRAAVEAAIPVGFHAYDSSSPLVNQRGSNLTQAADKLLGRFGDLRADVSDRYGRAVAQCGTLGGGNHFLEMCADGEGTIWLTLHSGSRNIGKELAERHIAKAKVLDHNAQIADPDLAVFLSGTELMGDYLHDLYWAQDYAALSRRVMLSTFSQVVAGFFPQVTFGEQINCFAGETGVLTDKGVKPIRDLAGASHTLLTADGRWVDAPVKSFGSQRLYEVVVGRFGEERVIRATAEHRWLLRPKVKHNRTEAVTTGLRSGDRLDYSFPSRKADLMPSREGVARGFVFGDGTTRLDIAAVAYFFPPKDDALLPYFDDAEKAATFYYEWDQTRQKTSHVPRDAAVALLTSGSFVGSYKRLNGLPVEWKREVPDCTLDDSYLYGWLSGYFAADGDVGKSGRPSLWSARRDHLEAVKTICDHLGIWTLPIRTKRHRGIHGFDATVFVMGISRVDLTPEFFVHDAHRRRWSANKGAVERRGWTVREVRETDVVEEVFCAVVPETHSFTLDGNILTGNCHHNYVSEETYDDVPLVITRKGAIFAGEGALGVIPGSMGTGSFIVSGLGNTDSFCSASHGAGRKMSRGQAKREFSLDDLAEQTRGIECRKDAGVLDEAPGAYKDIVEVIENQSDLVRVEARLETLLCVKG